jgi:predicted nucleic acid-binding protein
MYLFDTMILSYLIRQDPLAALYRSELTSGEPIFVSCQTVGEIRFGAVKINWGPDRIQKALKIVNHFAVLPLDEATATIYGDIRAGASRLGRPLLSQDAWILATAKQYNLILVSHDSDVSVGNEFGIKTIKR